MRKSFLQIGIFFCGLSVILGAFAAHALKQTLTAEAIAVFETGVKYQFFHGLVLLITGILYKDFNHKLTIKAGQLFIIGIIIFSGSLYTLALLMPDFRFIGAITPLGGLSFIVGWILLLSSVSKKNQ